MVTITGVLREVVESDDYAHLGYQSAKQIKNKNYIKIDSEDIDLIRSDTTLLAIPEDDFQQFVAQAEDRESRRIQFEGTPPKLFDLTHNVGLKHVTEMEKYEKIVVSPDETEHTLTVKRDGKNYVTIALLRDCDHTIKWGFVYRVKSPVWSVYRTTDYEMNMIIDTLAGVTYRTSLREIIVKSLLPGPHNYAFDKLDKLVEDGYTISFTNTWLETDSSPGVGKSNFPQSLNGLYGRDRYSILDS